MVQDIRMEQVLEELAMTSAKSESALWSILGFYFSIIFGLLAVLILLKTVKIGRLLDFSSASAEAVENVEGEKDTPSEISEKKTNSSKYAQPPKSLNGATKDAPTVKKPRKSVTPAAKAVSSTASSTAVPVSPVRVGTSTAAKSAGVKTPTSTKRKTEVPSTGRKRAKKDPDAPKRPLSAYLMFQNDKRAELIRSNPGMSSTEISVLASQMWKNELTAEQKKPYVEKEGALREQYRKEVTDYQAKKAPEEPMEVEESQEKVTVPSAKKVEKSPRRPKDPNAPKRPRTAFLVYNSSAENRKKLKEQFPEASPRDVMRLLGEHWAAMKPEEKDKYEEIAKKEKANYLVEKDSYEKKKAAEHGSSSMVDTASGNSGDKVDESQTKGTNGGFLGLLSNFFGMGTSDAVPAAKNQTPAKKTAMQSPTKSSTKKSTPVKKTPKGSAKKVSPVKKRTPAVPILSAKRALRSGKRKTRSSTP